jgi:2-polyprenyl-3-methyl-5-hydroxy-6-metoxy-1,4-benzoquinol methylase
MDILCEHLYLGIDKNPPKGIRFKKADFETGEGLESLPDFDVFVGLEIIEHLNDEGVNNFINIAHKAKKWIVVSTPIVPNSNPFHKQKFTEERILEEFKWSTWRHYQTFYQDKERYGIFIFKHV